MALAVMPGAAFAQTLVDFGPTAPSVGPNDIAQLSSLGNTAANAGGKPEGLNYYIDNTNNPGQIFTTGSNPSGYVLTSVSFMTAGLDNGGNGTGPQSYRLRINQYTNSTGFVSAPIASFDSPATFTFADGDWLQISGLAVGLSPNSQYTYAFQRDTTGWCALAVATNTGYAGGEIALVPTDGNAAVQVGALHRYDAPFVLGLSLGGPPVVGSPTATPNPVFALSPVALAASATGGGGSLTYQWQTNNDLTGGLGGAWGNVSGATTLTFTSTPPDKGTVYTLDFRLIATSISFGSATSTPAALLVRPASLPSITVDTTPSSVSAYSGSTVIFNATFEGTTPITNQWQTDAGNGGTFTNIPSATSATLTLANVQFSDSGHYRLRASNSQGAATSTPATLTVATSIFRESFNLPTQPDQTITNVGWRNDVQGAATRIFSGNGGVTFPNCAVYSYVGAATNEAFYATTATANGGPYGSITGHMAFPSINPATTANLTFYVDINSPYNGPFTHSFFAVQMNGSTWYVSTTELVPAPSSTTFATYSMPFSAAAAGWNQLTVSGNGSDNTIYPIIGTGALSDLTGNITGAGVVAVHSTSSTVQYDNFTITGQQTPVVLPVINSQPSSTTNFGGETAAFSVSATSNGVSAGLTYQWRAGTVGSGIYANLSNGGQFSGVTSSALIISNVTSAANHKDYVVVVSDAAGSVTSAPAATLTVVDSVPLLTSDTTIYPNAAPGFGASTVAIHAGNNNVLHLTASYIGDLPFSYQWKVSPNPDGSGAVNVPGATSSTLTLSNPQTNNSGYYSLQASNSQSVTPTNSAWAQLTVLPAATSFYQWSAAVPLNGLTSTQILSLPGTFLEAESFAAPGNVTVTVGTNAYLFDSTSASAILNGSFGAKTGVYTGPTTADANLDAVLNVDAEISSGASITLNNLTIGQLYSVQLIALNDTAGVTRVINFSDVNDAADVSPSFAVGDNVYVMGTFTATNVTQDISINMVANGYISAVIVRATKPTPTLSILKVGSNVQVTYANGILLDAANVNGPWATNLNASPYTLAPSGTRHFFRVQSP